MGAPSVGDAVHFVRDSGATCIPATVVSAVERVTGPPLATLQIQQTDGTMLELVELPLAWSKEFFTWHYPEFEE
jgi:hypothetical protein